MKMLFRAGLLAVAGSATLGTAIDAAAGTLTATSWGGAYSMSQRKAFYEPFMKETGHTVLEDEWGGDMAMVKAMVDTGNFKTHVIDGETADLLAGCEEGMLEPIDYAKLGLSKDDFIPGAAHECGIADISWSTIFAYDTTKFPNDAPKNWKDYWDVGKYAGKRGLYKSPSANLEIALMADGVPTGEVYDTLRSPGGVERAFSKLDQLRPHVIWWETGAQAPQLLADGEVSMTTAWNGRIYSAVVEDKRPFQIVWDGQLLDFDFWIIPKGHPEVDLAYEFIKFAVRPERQGDQTNYISYGTTRKGADKFVNPDILPHLPTAPQNMKNVLQVDGEFWADNDEDLAERFNVWVSKQ